MLEVLRDGGSVTEVALRFGVTRQRVHRWLRRYAARGLAGLADSSPRPDSCPHQMPPEVEALVVGLRRENPGWGPRTLLFELEARRVDPLPGRSSLYRCLVRHGLIEPKARRRRRSDYKRWERSRAMELWQMDAVGGVMLTHGHQASIVSGSMITRGLWCRLMWWSGPRLARLVTRWARRCGRRGCLRGGFASFGSVEVVSGRFVDANSSLMSHSRSS